jgi:uncharacterized protein YdaU (DUF1376 family)
VDRPTSRGVGGPRPAGEGYREQFLKNIWTSFYWSDYSRDTAHLSILEHGAYFLLLSHYYMTGGPISANAMHLHRICRCTDDAEKSAVDRVLAEFFTLDGDLWSNKRADMEIAKYSDISSKRRNAARKKWDAKALQMQMQMHTQSQSHIKPKAVEGGNGKSAPPQKFTQSDFDERDWRKISEAKKLISSKMGAAMGGESMTEQQFYQWVSEESGVVIQRVIKLCKQNGAFHEA